MHYIYPYVKITYNVSNAFFLYSGHSLRIAEGAYKPKCGLEQRFGHLAISGNYGRKLGK